MRGTKAGIVSRKSATKTDAMMRQTEKTDDNEEKESFVEALASCFAQAASETAQVAQAFASDVVETESEGANEGASIEPKRQTPEAIPNGRRLRRR